MAQAGRDVGRHGAGGRRPLPGEAGASRPTAKRLDPVWRSTWLPRSIS